MVDELSNLVKVYLEIKKCNREGFISPIEIIISIIEKRLERLDTESTNTESTNTESTNTESTILVGLTNEDLKLLREVPMESIGRREERYKFYTIEQNKTWVMNYIRRKRPDLYQRISIIKKVDYIMIMRRMA